MLFRSLLRVGRRASCTLGGSLDKDRIGAHFFLVDRTSLFPAVVVQLGCGFVMPGATNAAARLGMRQSYIACGYGQSYPEFVIPHVERDLSAGIMRSWRSIASSAAHRVLRPKRRRGVRSHRVFLSSMSLFELPARCLYGFSDEGAMRELPTELPTKTLKLIAVRSWRTDSSRFAALDLLECPVERAPGNSVNQPR